MLITEYSIWMTVLWSSVLILLFYILRKKSILLDICSVSGVMMHLENFIRRVYLTEQNSTRKHMQICMMRLNVDMLTEQEKRL